MKTPPPRRRDNGSLYKPLRPRRPQHTRPAIYNNIIHSPDPLINDFTLVSTLQERREIHCANTLHTRSAKSGLTLWPPTGCFNDRNLNLH